MGKCNESAESRSSAEDAVVMRWWTQAVSVGTNCSQNCRNSARLLSNPRTTVTVSSQVLLHQNRGRDSTIQNREDTLAVFTTKVCRTNTLLLYSPRSSNQSMLLEERFLGSSPAPRNDSTMGNPTSVHDEARTLPSLSSTSYHRKEALFHSRTAWQGGSSSREEDSRKTGKIQILIR
jgi:hypothetical protein